MAFGYYFNMEKLSITIAEKHLKNMTNDNYANEESLCYKKLINNMENGFVIITQLNCFFESFINTIVNICMGCSSDEFLKSNINKKIDEISSFYKKDFSNIKNKPFWETYRTTTKVRNEMIHYKKQYVGHSGEIPNFEIGKQQIGEFFTKKTMEKIMSDYQQLAKAIADTVGLKIFDKIDVIECDGRDGLVNYVYCDDNITIDESRFL